MAFDYARIAQLATQLLKEFGVTVVLRVREEAVYNPATGKTTYGYLDQEFKGTVNVTGVLDQYEDSEVDGSLIQRGDQKLYLDPQCPVTPKIGDVVVVPIIEHGQLIRHENYEVVASEPIRPAAVIVLHQLQLRRD